VSYVRFDFSPGYNDKNRERAEELDIKISRIMEKFDKTSYEFFHEIFRQVFGFYISSPNTNRQIERKNITDTDSRVSNILFRFHLGNPAAQEFNNTTIVLRGDLILKSQAVFNYVVVKDVYSTENTPQQSYEYYISIDEIDYKDLSGGNWFIPGGDNIITFDFAKNIPDMINKSELFNFLNKWRKYLEFEKFITLENMKSYPVSKEGLEYQTLYEVVDNAVNRIEYEESIIKEGGGHLLIDANCPKLKGDEPKYELLSVLLDEKLFGDEKELIIKKARTFAKLDISIIGDDGKRKLDALVEELRSKYKSSRDSMDIKCIEFDNYLPIEHENGMITFFLLKSIDDSSDFKIKNEIKKLGEKLYLANIASGDIALYKRGSDTLDKLEKSDVRNPFLAGILCEPDKFDTTSNQFTEENVVFALEDLNQSQKNAVLKCLNCNNIFLLQGPPGTGKTQTITELVYQYSKMGKKVLISSQTHIAIDNVIERLPKDLNILPVRLVRDRSKVNKQYLPDKILDNFYEAAYKKYSGIIDNYKKFEKDVKRDEQLFQNNKTLYKIIQQRLDEVKIMEDKRNNLNKELSALYSEKNELEAGYSKTERAYSLFNEYIKSKLPFENISSDFYNDELLQNFSSLIKKSNLKPNVKKEQEDLFNYAVLFKRIAGRERIKRLKEKLNGGERPKELIENEEKRKKLQIEIETFKKYGNTVPQELIQKMNNALSEKKRLDRKYEDSANVKEIKHSDKDFYFIHANNIKGKADIEAELEQITNFIREYNIILEKVFLNEEYNKLNDKKTGLENSIEKINNDIKRTTAGLKTTEQKILEINNPISENRNKLEEYFKEFYTKQLNGAALPVSDEDKFNEINEYLKQEKIKFEKFKENYVKLQGVYESLQNYLEKREEFAKEHRGKYTNDLLKKIANVYGMTCTSGQRFNASDLVGAENRENNLQVDEFNVRYTDFDVVIIDEVSKATPIEMLIPIICGKNIVLVGDQRQLPPIFKHRESMFKEMTEESKEKILQGESLDYYRKMVESSLFEEIFNKLKNNRAVLTEQFRFNESIMKCVNVFYDGKLKLGVGEEQNNKKRHYLNVKIKNGDTPVLCEKNNTYWFDSHEWADGSPAYSEVYAGESSYRNPLEVKLTIELLLLLEKGYKELKENKPQNYYMAASNGEKPSVAVLSMYGKHISSIKTELNARKLNKKYFQYINLDISTVDNYQGKEQDIIIVNMVANTTSIEPSEFLRKFNRINVAISRARSMLIMIGSRRYYNKVLVNVPNMDTGEENKINAYVKIFEQCESPWASAAKIFNINKEIKEAGIKK